MSTRRPFIIYKMAILSHIISSLLWHKCEKLEKARELFQVSRRLNHIAQQVTQHFQKVSLWGKRLILSAIIYGGKSSRLKAVRNSVVFVLGVLLISLQSSAYNITKVLPKNKCNLPIYLLLSLIFDNSQNLRYETCL